MKAVLHATFDSFFHRWQIFVYFTFSERDFSDMSSNGFFNDIYIYFRDNSLKGSKACISKHKIALIMLETSESTGGNFAAGGAEHRNLKFHR